MLFHLTLFPEFSKLGVVEFGKLDFTMVFYILQMVTLPSFINFGHWMLF
jgi:hypothetical protein